MRSLAMVAVVVVSACNSNYIPRRPGQVGVILQNGAPAYVRDGQVYRHGFLGSGLLRAVRGNPAAEAAAREYRDRIGTGAATGLLGMACMVGGVAYAASGAELDNTDQRDRRAETGALVALGCTVLMFGGLAYMGTAEPYRWDAINIFNDGPAPGTFYGAPGARLDTPPAQHTESLRMRGE